MTMLLTSRFFWSWTCRLLVVVMSLLALFKCPHSKVEESFNLQATHDLFYHGILPAMFSNTQELPYDHLHYPGVVPRTFVGPLVLAWACRCINFVWFLTTLSPMMVQFLARLVLLACNWHAWHCLSNAVRIKFGKSVDIYFLLTVACQFHLCFYASRMLPNVFSLVLTTHAQADFVQNKPRRAAILLVVATVVFRCDVLLLLFTMGLYWLLSKQLSLMQAIQIGLLSSLISLLVTVPLDSLLWQKWTWPEGEVFYFNTILGKSSEWGTLPWHWYVMSALPKSMLATLFLVPLVILRIPEYMSWWLDHATTQHKPKPPLLDLRMIGYMMPIVGFIGLYSFLGHKEMRFIFPALPMLNVAVAVGLGRLHQWVFCHDTTKDKSQKSRWLAWFAYGCGIACLVVTCVASLTFLAVSVHNYPGGQALGLLTKHVVASTATMSKGKTQVHVFIDNASAMSGVSLFGQAAAAASTQETRTEWTFEKAGYEQEHATVGGYSRFTHLLSQEEDIGGFHVVDIAQGYPRFDFQRGRIVTENAIYVQERNDWTP